MLVVPHLVWADTFLFVFVGLGQAGPFIFREGNAVIEEQVVAIAQAP
jgi:hypothetical protein